MLCVMQHPLMRSGCTQIISNNRGHLNPSVPRSPASPWGSFLGTWQTERKPIQLRTRTKLMAHLAQIDQKTGGGGSRKSSRASSARVMSQRSQRLGDTGTSPRPHSAVESEGGDRESKPGTPDSHGVNQSAAGDGSKLQTPATADNSKPPTPSTEAGSKPPTPATEAGSKPPTPDTEAGSKPPTPAPGSPLAPQPPTSRAASAASSRTSVSLQSCTPASSRAQSAAVTRGPPQTQPPLPDSSVHSRVSSAAPASCGGAQSPLSSTRVSPPHTPTKLEPDTST